LQPDARQWAVRVMVRKDGPQDTKLYWLRVKLIFARLFTVVCRSTFDTGGAHLKESTTLPELPIPALTEKTIETGFVAHSSLDDGL
jgi:hypothetical protein